VSNSGLNIDTIVYGETSPSNNATFTPISLTVTQDDEIQGYYSTAWSIKYLTLRYTKTTDTAGSGQWTPQGVPAVHYSTDEQIVGTWIDRKPLYEKTFKIDNASIDTAHATEIADLTALNIETWVCVLHSVGYLHTYGVYINENRLSVGYSPTSKKLIAGQSYTQQYTTTDILTTIRYTKSSS
jgi:hypothetical protein